MGDSPKKNSQDALTASGRRIIGKFGIGKLATYAIARRITYVSRAAGRTLQVLCDFDRFEPDADGERGPVELDVREVTDLPSLLARPDMQAVLEKLGLDGDALVAKGNPDWTLCLLDNLKPSAARLQIGRLGWVLRTAMPLKFGFSVHLDGVRQESSKADAHPVVDFMAGELDADRIKAINKASGMRLAPSEDGQHLVEPDWFPLGIHGRTIVTEETLKGKSDRWERSFGFFIRVRNRLINIDDPLFHNAPFSFKTFNRLRSELDIDDLHADLTAPREGVGTSERRNRAVAITHAIGLQARDLYEDWLERQADEKQTPEHVRVYVAEHLVERPMADALAMHGSKSAGGDVDRSFLYMEDVEPEQLPTVIKQLNQKRTKYRYRPTPMGRDKRIGLFDPQSATFLINEDHQLVQAYYENPMAKELIHLLATAEVMLEVYMVESDLDPFTIGDLLGRRDILMRSLANDRVFSKKYIAQMLRGSSDSDIDLELALVAAARALGFQVSHVAGSGEPDGVARFLDSAMEETKITLEAKSSKGTPHLAQLDFGGLGEHRDKEDAAGCLLVAPSYPRPTAQAAEKSGNEGAVANRAKAGRISCWTIEQLATVVENADRLEITTQEIAEIVTSSFSPEQVSTAIASLLAERPDMPVLYAAIMDTLEAMFNRRANRGNYIKVQTVVGALFSTHPELEADDDMVKGALKDLARRSRGGMKLNKDTLIFYNGFDEVRRETSELLGTSGPPRALGTFSIDPD